jgi:hypothetical protein
MPRARHHYYDPILQTDAKVEGAPDLSRIELFPVGQESTSRLPEQIGKWVGRKIGTDGRIEAEAPGDFDHDRALKQAQELWPGLTVYELNAEIDDSTWEGSGPSPRLWQNAITISQPVSPVTGELVPPAVDDQQSLRVLPIANPGNYLLVDDVLALLEGYAAQFDDENNPSAALGLREAAQALREAF